MDFERIGAPQLLRARIRRDWAELVAARAPDWRAVSCSGWTSARERLATGCLPAAAAGRLPLAFLALVVVDLGIVFEFFF